jgi:iron complex transport system permease protein
MAAGPDHRRLVTASALGGALFLLWCDTLARTAFAVAMPVGAITALFGGPFFLVLLARGRRAGRLESP